MNIFKIAMNNLKRRMTKSLFLMLGLVAGVATIVAVLSIVQAMELDLGDRIDEFGANAVILPRSEGLEMNGGSSMTTELTFDVQPLTMDDLPAITASEVGQYINIVSPKLIGAAQANGQTVLVVGLQAQKEFAQKPWFSLNQQAGVTPGETVTDLALFTLPDDALLLGSSAALALNAQVGSQLLLNDVPFTVLGILNETGAEEDGLVYAELGAVQALLGRPGELSMIEISAYCNNCPIEEVAAGLEQSLPNSRVTPLRQAALFREETIGQFTTFGFALSAIVLFIATMMVLKTMISSVNERTREIGIFRAIGFRRSHIVSILFLEAGIVSLLAGILGFLLGSVGAFYAGPYLAQLQSPVPVQFGLVIPAVVLSAVLSILASTYPAIKAANLDPAESLRFI